MIPSGLHVICAFYLGLTSTEQGKEDSAKKVDADPEGLQLAQVCVYFSKLLSSKSSLLPHMCPAAETCFDVSRQPSLWRMPSSFCALCWYVAHSHQVVASCPSCGCMTPTRPPYTQTHTQTHSGILHMYIAVTTLEVIMLINLSRISRLATLTSIWLRLSCTGVSESHC